jgi:hypothetical protein
LRWKKTSQNSRRVSYESNCMYIYLKKIQSPDLPVKTIPITFYAKFMLMTGICSLNIQRIGITHLSRASNMLKRRLLSILATYVKKELGTIEKTYHHLCLNRQLGIERYCHIHTSRVIGPSIISLSATSSVELNQYLKSGTLKKVTISVWDCFPIQIEFAQFLVQFPVAFVLNLNTRADGSMNVLHFLSTNINITAISEQGSDCNWLLYVNGNVFVPYMRIQNSFQLSRAEENICTLIAWCRLQSVMEDKSRNNMACYLIFMLQNFWNSPLLARS